MSNPGNPTNCLKKMILICNEPVSNGYDIIYYTITVSTGGCYYHRLPNYHI